MRCKGASKQALLASVGHTSQHHWSHQGVLGRWLPAVGIFHPWVMPYHTIKAMPPARTPQGSKSSFQMETGSQWMQMISNDDMWRHVPSICSLDSKHFTFHTLSIEFIEWTCLRAKIAAKVSGVGKPLLHQGTLQPFPRCINNSFCWLASKPLLMTTNSKCNQCGLTSQPKPSHCPQNWRFSNACTCALIRTGLAVVIAAVYKLDEAEAVSSLNCRWSINLTGQCKLMKCTTFSKWNHWVLPCPVSHDKVTLDMEFKHPNFNQPISLCTCNSLRRAY